jgi:hypothetical protein
MRRQAKSPLIESYTHHDEPLYQSRRYRARGHKTGSKLRCYNTPLMGSSRYSRVTSDVGQLDSAIKTRKERTTPCMLNYYLVVFQRIVSLFSLFSVVGMEAEE